MTAVDDLPNGIEGYGNSIQRRIYRIFEKVTNNYTKIAINFV